MNESTPEEDSKLTEHDGHTQLLAKSSGERIDGLHFFLNDIARHLSYN
jgi:hypothetical protein